MIDNKKLGDRISKIRKQNSYTQEMLAEELGFGDRVKIYRIEKGKQSMTANELVNFCDLFKISLDNLISDSEINSQDFIEFGDRYIKNLEISEEEKREVIKNIYIKLAEYEIDNTPMSIKMNKNVNNVQKCTNIPVEKYEISSKIIDKGGV